MAEVTITIKLATSGPIHNLDYLEESITYAVEHYRSAEGLTHEDDPGYVLSVEEVSAENRP